MMTCEVIYDDFKVLINNINVGNNVINKCIERYIICSCQYNNINNY